MFNLFKKPIAGGNSSVKDIVNNALDISNDITNTSGNGIDNNKLEVTGSVNDSKIIKECSHFFIRYPPLIGKIKTCIKCVILLGSHTDFLNTNQ